MRCACRAGGGGGGDGGVGVGVVGGGALVNVHKLCKLPTCKISTKNG